jgi:hypothetical protein
MEYDKLKSQLQYYSFESKVAVLNTYSRKVISPAGYLTIAEEGSQPYPWELETLLLLFIGRKETQNKQVEEKRFIDWINCIRNYHAPVMEQAIQNEYSIENVLAALMSVQGNSQMFYIYLLYRFDYYFHFQNQEIDMPKVFLEEFGCPYETFQHIGFTIQSLYSILKEIPTQLLADILHKYRKAGRQLTISREDYTKKLNFITKNEAEYLYCLRPSYKYPFLEYQNRLYIPLPHLLEQSITSSLMFRLTEGKNELRSLIGKNVFESYLYKLACECKLYDEVVKEQQYKVQGTINRSPDVQIRINNSFLFLDSKSTTPRIGIGLLHQSDIEDMEEVLASYCVQMYKQLVNHFGKDYYGFSHQVPISRDNLWCIIVTQEEIFVPREEVYKKAEAKLRIQNAEQKNWIESHIKICGIYTIERFCFANSDLISAMKAVPAPEGLLCTIKSGEKIQSQKIMDFKSKLADSLIEDVEEHFNLPKDNNILRECEKEILKDSESIT